MAAYTSPEFEQAVSELCEVAQISKSDLVRSSLSRTLIELAEAPAPRSSALLSTSEDVRSSHRQAQVSRGSREGGRAQTGEALSEAHRQAISRGKRGKKIADHIHPSTGRS